MKQLIKNAMHRLAPSAANQWFNARKRAHIERLFAELGLPAVVESVRNRYGGTVQTGPFAGMKYDGRATGSTAAPKLIGSYESEIAPWIEQLCADSYDCVIDIGCAEGYYAVGMALRSPASKVVAFDIDSTARALCTELARLNGVSERIEVRSTCDPPAMRRRWRKPLPVGR